MNEEHKVDAWRLARWRYLRRRIVQVKTSHGVVATARMIPLIVWQMIFGDGRDRRWPDRSGAVFDAAHAVDTTGIIPIAALDVDAPNWVYGFDYQAVETLDFADILAPLRIDYPATDFIDLGAGKGRAVMMASTLPFRRRVGVEISPQLAGVAIRNLTRYHGGADSGGWEIVCADAAAFRFPDCPLVVFMYNPFMHPVMSRVITHLVDSCRANPRRIIVIYVRPELEQMWLHAIGCREVLRSTRYRVYEFS